MVPIEIGLANGWTHSLQILLLKQNIELDQGVRFCGGALAFANGRANTCSHSFFRAISWLERGSGNLFIVARDRAMISTWALHVSYNLGSRGREPLG